MDSKNIYLGDAVYLTVDSEDELLLTTDSHILSEAGNIIFINPEVAAALNIELTAYLLKREG